MCKWQWAPRRGNTGIVQRTALLLSWDLRDTDRASVLCSAQKEPPSESFPWSWPPRSRATLWHCLHGAWTFAQLGLKCLARLAQETWQLLGLGVLCLHVNQCGCPPHRQSPAPPAFLSVSVVLSAVMRACLPCVGPQDLGDRLGLDPLTHQVYCPLMKSPLPSPSTPGAKVLPLFSR